MATREEKLATFRAMHERPGTWVIPNPWDAGSAKLLTALGFEALTTTSSGLALMIAGHDGAGKLTREAVLDNAREIIEATHLPVAADLLDCFSADPEEAAKTIEMSAEVGLVGGSIEDSTPDPANPIYPLELAVERVAAAAETAKRVGFVLVARAEEWLHLPDCDVDKTIERLNAFAEAGADALYAPGLPNLDAIAKVCSSVSKPVNVVMGLRPPTYSIAELRDAGVKRISIGGSMARIAYGAMVEAAREILDEGTFTYADKGIKGRDLWGLMG